MLIYIYIFFCLKRDSYILFLITDIKYMHHVLLHIVQWLIDIQANSYLVCHLTDVTRVCVCMYTCEKYWDLGMVSQDSNVSILGGRGRRIMSFRPVGLHSKRMWINEQYLKFTLLANVLLNEKCLPQAHIFEHWSLIVSCLWTLISRQLVVLSGVVLVVEPPWGK